jgi:hypothetical protein
VPTDPPAIIPPVAGFPPVLGAEEPPVAESPPMVLPPVSTLPPIAIGAPIPPPLLEAPPPLPVAPLLPPLGPPIECEPSQEARGKTSTRASARIAQDKSGLERLSLLIFFSLNLPVSTFHSAWKSFKLILR